jgi:hypothetical protein
MAFDRGDRVADIGGRYYTVFASGTTRSLVIPDGTTVLEFAENDQLVKLERCKCGAMVEPYAPCGSPECYGGSNADI